MRDRGRHMSKSVELLFVDRWAPDVNLPEGRHSMPKTTWVGRHGSGPYIIVMVSSSARLITELGADVQLRDDAITDATVSC